MNRTLEVSFNLGNLIAIGGFRMNKAELVEAIAKVTLQTKADTERTLDALTDTIAKNIKKKDGVKLVGFGTFAVSARKARLGRNPQTGAEIQIPARKVPVFRPGKELKEAAR
jgi:DNA-binding protein HU-beta